MSFDYPLCFFHLFFCGLGYLKKPTKAQSRVGVRARAELGKISFIKAYMFLASISELDFTGQIFEDY